MNGILATGTLNADKNSGLIHYNLATKHSGYIDRFFGESFDCEQHKS